MHRMHRGVAAPVAPHVRRSWGTAGRLPRGGQRRVRGLFWPSPHLVLKPHLDRGASG
jgi:hypothetical protein